MKESLITNSTEETRALGEKIANETSDNAIICLDGDLGAGKTTFTQGLLKGLGAQGPYTSPTFVIMKKYEINNEKIKNVYHIDAYRVDAESIYELGWEEFSIDPTAVTIIEWADRVKEIIPKNAIWINLEWIEENKRKITISDTKQQN